MEKSCEGKRFKSECEKKQKLFIPALELQQWKFLSFHAQYLEEEWENTLKYEILDKGRRFCGQKMF